MALENQYNIMINPLFRINNQVFLLLLFCVTVPFSALKAQDSNSYLSKVFNNSTDFGVLFQLNEQFDETMSSKAYSVLQHPDIRFFFYLNSKNSFLVLLRESNEEGLNELRHRVTLEFDGASFKKINMREVDDMLDEEARLSAYGKSLLPTFYATNHPDKKTTAIIVSVPNPKEDYPRMLGLDLPRTTFNTYLPRKGGYIVLIQSKNKTEIENIKQSLKKLIPEVKIEDVPNMHVLDLISEGIL